MELSIANVINVSVSTPEAGAGQYNTSNIAIFTRESYDDVTFGDNGYKIYLEPDEVATDFGSDSDTYAMAVALFSQQPNILLGNGYLVIIPMLEDAQTAVQTISFDRIAASGSFVLDYDGSDSAAIDYDDEAADIQTKIRAIDAALASVVVSGSIAEQSLVVTFTGVSGAAALFTVESNTLADSDSNAVTVTPATTTIGSSAETYDKALLRATPLVEYFGAMCAEINSEGVSLLAAAYLQTKNKIGFDVSYTEADIDPGGRIDLLRTGSYKHTRGLYYGDNSDTTAEKVTEALKMMAAYAGRGLSTNFNGSNTTQTLHLKTLSTIQPDPTMTQTILNKAIAAGADTYVSIRGVSKVFCSGQNDFFDNQYNLGWFVGALEVAAFNALAQVSTKVPQTEAGMDVLKGAQRRVCEQAITNQFLAPGSWTAPNTFGNQADFFNNIEERGYYIYSVPISQQLPATRETRTAPLVQIAVKYAGALHSASTIINVNP